MVDLVEEEVVLKKSSQVMAEEAEEPQAEPYHSRKD